MMILPADRNRKCRFCKSDSVNTVRNLVDGAAGAISSNEYYALNEGNAQGGCPSSPCRALTCQRLGTSLTHSAPEVVDPR
jgi:hypothetical protein